MEDFCVDVDEILKTINDIFIEELENDDIVLKRESTVDDVEEWDSLSHIQLVVAIEKHYEVRFTSVEIQKFNNVGDMCDSIKTKLT